MSNLCRWAIAGLMLASRLGAAADAEQRNSADQRSQIVTVTTRQGGQEGSPNTQLATLQGIDMVNVHGSIRLQIRISSAVRPIVTTLTDPDRLVLDFPGTVSSAANRIAVNRYGVTSVRIGVQPVDPPVTRVVVDLSQPRTYKLSVDRTKVAMELGADESPSVATKSGSNPPAGARNEPTPANVAPASPDAVTLWAVNTGASNAGASALMVNSARIQESQLLDPSEQDNKTSEQPKASNSVLTANLQEAVVATKGAIQGTDLNRILNQAEAGDSTAQYEMAVRCANGEGVPQNYRRAMAWFAKAAANGNANAQWELGLGYLKGIGVPQDERKAAEWFKTAANQGHIRAQSALSDLYFDGRGVPRDYIRAYTWASIATGLRGNDNDRLKVIGSRMTAVQIADAHQRISSWWEGHKLKAASPARVSSLASAAALSTSLQNVDGAPPHPVARTPETAKTIESRPANSTVAASGTSTAANRGQWSGAPASGDLVQEPIQSSTLGGGSGSEPANPVVPVSVAASLADPAPNDAAVTKITSSQNNPVTPPQAAPQAQQHEQQQAPPGNQSSQTETSAASSEQNTAATVQQPANAPAQPKNEPEPARPSISDTKPSQNAPATPPQAAPQAQQQAQQQATPGNESSQTDTPTASSEQNAAATIQQPTNTPAQPKNEPESARPSISDTQPSQNAPATPPQAAPQAQQQAQQQATPGNESSQTDTPTAISEQNGAATIQQPTNTPAQPKNEAEPARPSISDTKPSQNAPANPPQAAPQAQQQEQQQATPENQSSQTDTTANSEQNAAATSQQPANAPAQPKNEPEPAKPSTPGGGPVSAVANSSLTAPLVAPPLNAADVAETVDRAKQQLSPDEYVIGEQDQLTITVWKEPEFSGPAAVRPDGKITMPLLNEVKAAGLTPAQLQTLLTEKLKPFLNVPQVTVAVRQINSRNVYLIGEVNREGTFPINSSTTVLQLIAEAGGLKDFAKRKGIYVLRNEQGKQVRLQFNYEEVIRGKNNQQNIVLQPGDTVVVP